MKNWNRRREDVIDVVKPGGIGIELGVAEGVFSERVLRKNRLSHLYSVDVWAGDRTHTTDEYKTALRKLLPFKEKSTVLRMTFDEALDLFPDESFDFIYFDGYAHDAQQGGTTFEKWYPKMKPGSVIAGDDYHPHHPENVKAIDAFCEKYDINPFLIDCHEPYSVWSEYPTWFGMKKIDLKGKDIALVGNNTKLLSTKDLNIDQHEVVVRMNRAAPFFQPHSECIHTTGIKTDIWAMWRFDEYENYDFNREDFYRLQVAPEFGSHEKRLELYSDQRLQDMKQKYQIENPSTGLRTLDWVLSHEPKSISLYGFDWKATPTWTDQNRTVEIGCPHDWSKEKNIVASLLKENDHIYLRE